MKAEVLFDVRGLVTIVTGAASGLGLAMAEVMADNGANVTLLDIDANSLEAAVVTLRARGATVTPLLVDVSDLDRLSSAIDSVAATHGKLDVVFANAGRSAGPGFAFGSGWIDTVDLATWQKVLDVNLTSIFVTLQAAARNMKPRRSGRIIVTSSIAGLKSEPQVGYAYAGTKAAVINLVRHAAIELAPHNVLVNAIAPGPFRTNIAGGRLRDPAIAKVFADSVPLGRIAETSELQGLALYLASPASSYVTGTVIPIDGGTTAT